MVVLGSVEVVCWCAGMVVSLGFSVVSDEMLGLKIYNINKYISV